MVFFFPTQHSFNKKHHQVRASKEELRSCNTSEMMSVLEGAVRESERWCLVTWRMRMDVWVGENGDLSSFIGDYIGRVGNKVRGVEVSLHHGGQVPVVTFWWWPYGTGRMVQTWPWNHTQNSSGSDSTLHPHCCHREVVMSLRDVPQWVLDLIPQVLNVLPLFLRQALPTHVDVLHLQLLLIKQPLHNKHRRYTGKNDTCDPVFQYR